VTHANRQLARFQRGCHGALLVIGSKILSGRTKDQNVGYITEYLTATPTRWIIWHVHAHLLTPSATVTA
jgi:molybdopterin-biosynthesis enzyme MoeA-like protein